MRGSTECRTAEHAPARRSLPILVPNDLQRQKTGQQQQHRERFGGRITSKENLSAGQRQQRSRCQRDRSAKQLARQEIERCQPQHRRRWNHPEAGGDSAHPHGHAEQHRMKRKKLRANQGRVCVVKVPADQLQMARQQLVGLLPQCHRSMAGQKTIPLVALEIGAGACSRCGSVDVAARIASAQQIFVRLQVEKSPQHHQSRQGDLVPAATAAASCWWVHPGCPPQQDGTPKQHHSQTGQAVESHQRQRRGRPAHHNDRPCRG